MCEMCGVCFTSSSGLKKHRLKFCVGSKLHKNVLAKKNELRQPHFDPDALASYLSGEPLPAGVPRAAGKNLDKLSVAQLRQQLTHDAANRAQAAKAASRAAEQLKERRAEMEAQQREVEERLRRQRMVRDTYCSTPSSPLSFRSFLERMPSDADAHRRRRPRRRCAGARRSEWWRTRS